MGLNEGVLALCQAIRASNLERVEVIIQGDGRVALYAIDHRGFTRTRVDGDAFPGGPMKTPSDALQKFQAALGNPLTHGKDGSQ